MYLSRSLTSHFLLSQLYLFPKATALHTETDAKINSYWQGGFAQNITGTTPEPYPTCSITGRVKIKAHTIGSSAFQQLVGDNEVEISVNEDLIAEFVKNIRDGNYMSEIFHPELPYVALAAFANNPNPRFKRDLSNALTWYEAAKDYPEGGLKISPLFDDRGEWTDEARAYSKLFVQNPYWGSNIHQIPSPELLETIRTSMRHLPRSQQVFARFQHAVPNGHVPLAELSFEADRILFEKRSGRQVIVESRLGPLSREVIVKALMLGRQRICHIPFPGISTEKVWGEREITSLELAYISRGLWEHMYNHSPLIVDVFRELILMFRGITGESMSDEIWGLSLFGGMGTAPLTNSDINVEFDTRLQFINDKLQYGGQFTLLTWSMALHLHVNRGRLEEQYGLNIDKIPTLNQMNHLMKLADPFLQLHSNLERIYLLQKLASLGITDDTGVRHFFQENPVHLPRLTLKRAYWLDRQSRDFPEQSIEDYLYSSREFLRILADGKPLRLAPPIWLEKFTAVAKFQTGLLVLLILGRGFAIMDRGRGPLLRRLAVIAV